MFIGSVKAGYIILVFMNVSCTVAFLLCNSAPLRLLILCAFFLDFDGVRRTGDAWNELRD